MVNRLLQYLYTTLFQCSLFIIKRVCTPESMMTMTMMLMLMFMLTAAATSSMNSLPFYYYRTFFTNLANPTKRYILLWFILKPVKCNAVFFKQVISNGTQKCRHDGMCDCKISLLFSFSHPNVLSTLHHNPIAKVLIIKFLSWNTCVRLFQSQFVYRSIA